MNSTLKQYQQMINAIDSPKKIDDWITYGDYTLFCVNRLTLHELAEDGELTAEESYAVADLDETFKEHVTEDQLKQLIKVEAGMPIKAWWG